MKASVQSYVVATGAFLSGGYAAPQFGGASSGATRCCILLSLAHRNGTYFPNSPAYRASINSYWAQQARTDPACIALPGSAQEVSQITTMLVNNTCSFAIRSGGHNPYPNNNIDDKGVTIDLSRLSSVSIIDGRNGTGRAAAIGPGARWQNVYDFLTPLNLGVPGGRAAEVGVGGLTIGGGYSFFSGRNGFVCDNVENFEVVLGDGRIVNANAAQNSDLWQALKGGSNNFGIVTRIDLTAFDLPRGEIWGGVVLYSPTTIPQQIQAFVDFTNKMEEDPGASLITFWAYSSAQNITIVQNCYEYTTLDAPGINAPQFGPINAPIFRDLLDIKPELPIPNANTLRTANLTSLTQELNAPFGSRDLFATLSFNNDADIISDVYNISQTLLKPLMTTKGLNWTTMFQPVPSIFAKHGVARGGNVMGLDRAKGNQVLFLFFVGWESAADDKEMQTAASTLMERVTFLTQEKRKNNEWIYLNYASQTQDVLSSYGAENVAKIQTAAQKYDPQRVFQKLVPGGHKISGVRGNFLDIADP